MKKYLFIVSIMFLISTCFFSACKEKEEEPENPFRENIIGQWKLNQISIRKNQSQLDMILIDCSKENIIFDFQENNKLVIHGSIPNDLGLFDDLQEGGHSYKYYQPCLSCCPGPNLSIDEPSMNKENQYYCYPRNIEIDKMGYSKFSIILNYPYKRQINSYLI